MKTGANVAAGIAESAGDDALYRAAREAAGAELGDGAEVGDDVADHVERARPRVPGDGGGIP